MTKIQSVDTSAWTEDDKTSFKTSLTGLKTEIDIRLAALPAPAKKRRKKGCEKNQNFLLIVVSLMISNV